MGSYDVTPKVATKNNMHSLRLKGFQVIPEPDYLESRKVVLTNSDVDITLASPQNLTQDYFYKNADSDEVLYYVDGDFMSRNDIEPGHISLHPAGIPHGPHPGAVERSIGQTETEELAVMVDTFKPLMVTEEGAKIADKSYHQSWLEH